MPAEKSPPQVVFLPLGTPEPGVSLQRWLYEALRSAILGGRLPAGSKLPSTRALAEHYKLARGTAQAAYQQLLSEGYLEAQTGSGTRVCQVLPDATLNAGYVRRKVVAMQEVPRTPPATPWIERLDAITPIFARRPVMPGLRPFFPHRGDTQAFPVDLWRKLHIQQLRASRLSILLDSDPGGLPALREAIAGYLAIARGVQVPAERILVLSSVQQGLDLCLRLLAPGNSQVWMEDPGYPGARQLIDVSGVQRVDVRSARQMLDAVQLHAHEAQVFIATAAVADWRPAHSADQKIKKDGSGDTPQLSFVENPDILATIAQSSRGASGELFCVGFAAESHDLLAHATAKRLRKGVPLLVGNIGPATFGQDDNALLLVDPAGARELPRASKQALAVQLIDDIAHRLK